MKSVFKLYTSLLLLIVVLLLPGFSAFGQAFRFVPRDVNELRTAKLLKEHNGDDTIIVKQDRWDQMLADGSSWGNNLKFKSVHAFVRFSVNHRYPVKIQTPYTFRLVYKIYGYGNMADTTAYTESTDTLTITYKPDSLATFQDMQYRKYSNYHKIMIVTKGIYEINGAGSVPALLDMSPTGPFNRYNFNLEGGISIQPYNKKVKNGASYVDAYGGTPPFVMQSLTPVNDYMPVRWNLSSNSISSNLLLKPASYELEWAYVDNYRVSNSGAISEIPANQLTYDFRNNSTRVWLDTNYYQIPMIYQKGYIVYRMRLVRPDSVNYQYPIYSNWTLGESGVVSSAGAANYRQITAAHMNDGINWQYTVSFAEQGKYKQVLSYYDGMLKNRQSITRFNSMPDKLIATQQVYDYEGRPSISILPTPIPVSSFSYQQGLTLNAYSGLPYKASDFDYLSLSVCPNDSVIFPLGTGSPANIYYSALNPDKAGFQKFVPDAKGYPLVQTIYSPGYDERVEKQGGAGDSLQIGYKHNVKNDYVSADQMDLNRLFGLDIGWSGFYRKTVSRDPNGQLSLNVTDYRGKTVTSSMIGIPDTLIHAIKANENLADTAFYNEDHIAGTAQQIMGNKRILDKNFFNDAAGNNLSWYVYNFSPFTTFCPGKYLSVKARYDYSIFDECGTLVVDTGGTLGTTGVLTSGTVTPYTSPQIPFFMEKGKHSLHKELTVNTDEVDKAVEEFMAMAPAENCMKTEPWFIKESVLSKEFPCPENYMDMDCNSCAGKKFEMMQELWPNKDSVYVKRKYGIYRKNTGTVLGNNNSIFTLMCGYGPNSDNWGVIITEDTIRSVIGQGNWGGEGNGSGLVLGPGNFGPGIFDGGFVLDGTDTMHCKYRYQDTCLVHLPASVTRFGHTYTNLQSLPVDTFIYVFNDSIAEALLPLHPEYCSLLNCVDDVYEKKIRSIPDAKVAKALSRLRLSQLIANDPIYIQMLTMPTQFPNPFDTLAYSIQGIMCLDTLALLHAYCSVYDSVMMGECYTSMFNNEISSGVLINEYVEQRYFEMIRQMYLGNRKRYLYVLNPDASALGGCSTCQEVRMTLVPLPVFMETFNPDGTMPSGPGSFLGNINSMAAGNPNGAGNVDPIALLNQYQQFVDSIPTDTVYVYNDSATVLYANTVTTLCLASVDQIIAQLVNCADSLDLLPVKATLELMCTQGQVAPGGYTPEQIRYALTVNNIPLGDLCNAYLINYDGIMGQPVGMEGGNFTCNNDAFYNDLNQTLGNGNLLHVLKNQVVYNNYSLNPTNQFEQAIASELNSPTCSFSSVNDNVRKVHILSFYTNADTVKVFFKTAPSGTWATPFIQPTGMGLGVSAQCVNNIPNMAYLANGLVGKFAFAATATHINGSGFSPSFTTLAWSDKIEMNNLGTNPISGCVPCTQMRSLYKDFRDTLTAYQVKGTDHPYYRTMLRNFMNYKLRKSYTQQQYLDFVESCALADSMKLPKYPFYFCKIFSNSTDATNFMNALNNFDPTIEVSPAYHLKITGDYYHEIGYNFTGVPVNKYRVFRNYISSFNLHMLNNPYSNAFGASYVGWLFVPASSGFSPGASIFNNSPGSFTFDPNGSWQLWNGTGFELCGLYNVYTPLPNDHANNSRNANTLSRYLFENNIPGKYFPAIESTVNEDYHLPEKQAYLNYTYSKQTLPPNKVLDSLQVAYLISGVSVFNNKTLSYGHPAAPGNIENLYVLDPSKATIGTQYAKLQYILNAVKNYFLSTTGKSTIFFTGSNTVNILPNNQLTAIRCGDTAFWYRYFGAGDTLYNVFLRYPEYIDTADLPDYEVYGYNYNPGEEQSRSFHITLKNPALPNLPMELTGFTDFTVAKNLVLNNVLLAHPVNESIPVADTVNNCERNKLEAAISEGKINYVHYVDSIREKLQSDFFAHVMGNGVQEQLFVGYKNQRFNYTLYYYDRAGNLMRTIPPAGITMLANSKLLHVNTGRGLASTVDTLLPQHNKPSDYKYNSLNQVFEQHTPDGGTTDYFYDAAGRAIFSQNDKQRPLGKMTYTLYDQQGRIMETGQAGVACPYFEPVPLSSVDPGHYQCAYQDMINNEITPFPPVVHQLKSLPHQDVINYVRALTREEVVLTHYDTAAINLPVAGTGMSAQDNLRKRVSCIKYFDFLQPADAQFSNYNYAMHFSYDIAGNVKTLTRDYPDWKHNGQEFKRIDYDYDLISGKVNLLSYNRSFADQYFQRYAYDADNRITMVETSSDSYIWKRDAEYQYYQHGPLARMSLGDLRVQGVDYAYTIQGWLKAINGDLLDTAKDMGNDGNGNIASNNVHAKDAVALTLDYFKSDYTPIGTTAVMHIAPMVKNLYNGNIPRATTAIAPFPDLASTYTYDQLNRIIRADYAGLNRSTAALTNTANYYSSYAYDPDGNLKKLVRNGNKPASLGMDSLIYRYTNNAVADNKLQNVNDYAANNYTNDLKQHLTANISRYLYDATGNVIKDQVSGQDTIIWNHYNKVTETQNDSLDNGLTFAYDGAGNRYLKSVVKTIGDTTLEKSDYYVRDAQGNILAIYNAENKYVMSLHEWVEYITLQYCIACTREVYIGNVIGPAYGQNGHFKTSVLGTAMNNLSWAQSQLALSPVSFYVLQNAAVKTNVLSGTTNYSTFYTALAAYSTVQSQLTLGNALNVQLADEEKNLALLNNLLVRDGALQSSIFNMLCSQAPNLLENAMSGMGLSYQSGCTANTEYLVNYFNDHPNLVGSFMLRVDQTGASSYVNEYKNYLATLYSPNTLFDVEGGQSTAFGLMCTHSYDLLRHTMVLQGMSIPSGCEATVNSLHAALSNVNTLFEFIGTYVVNGKSSYTAQYEAYQSQITMNTGLSDMNAAQEHVLAMLCTHVPEAIEYVMNQQGLDYSSTDCGLNATVLAAKIEEKPSVLEDLINDLQQRYRTNLAIGYEEFIKALSVDNIILQSPYYTGAQGKLVAGFQEALDKHGSATQLAAFFDTWAPARDLLEHTNSTSALLAVKYDGDPAAFLNAYVTANSGNTAILVDAISAIPGLTLTGFGNVIQSHTSPCVVTVVTEVLHSAYEQALQYQRINLGSHHLYGSSRLGTKDYLPGQYYRLYDNQGPAPVFDTIQLNGRRPWYSMEYQDGIVAPYPEPWGNTDNSKYTIQHQVGQKQYELTNHLGNVQATISDLPVAGIVEGSDTIRTKHPALASAYDYYPFGMLMPDRYVSDTSAKCATITQTKWVTNWVDHCYDVYGWVWPNYNAVHFGTAQIDGGNIAIQALASDDEVSFGLTVVPGVLQELSVDLNSVDINTGTLQIAEEVNGNMINLASTLLSAKGNIKLNFTPSTSNIKVIFRGPIWVKIARICVKKPVMIQQTMLVDVCDDDKDRYRFGFNGQEKVNEWAGIGNHNTAEFWEYDTRTGRRLNLDPKADWMPYESPYATNHGNPIISTDPDGDIGWIGGIIGAVVGGAIELGSQMISNYVQNKPILGNVDWADVAISAGEGAVIGATGGASLLVSPVTKGVAATLRASVDWKPNARKEDNPGFRTVGGILGGQKKDPKDFAADVVSEGVGAVVGFGADKIAGKTTKILHNGIENAAAKVTREASGGAIDAWGGGVTDAIIGKGFDERWNKDTPKKDPYDDIPDNGTVGPWLNEKEDRWDPWNLPQDKK